MNSSIINILERLEKKGIAELNRDVEKCVHCGEFEEYWKMVNLRGLTCPKCFLDPSRRKETKDE